MFSLSLFFIFHRFIGLFIKHNKLLRQSLLKYDIVKLENKIDSITKDTIQLLFNRALHVRKKGK